MINYLRRILSTIAITSFLLCIPAFADDVSVTLNGVKVEFDVPPSIVESRTLVPVRAIFEALNIGLEWDNSTKTVYAEYEDTNIIIPVGSKIAYKNSTPIQMDVAATIIDGRTLVPVRFISENFGLVVTWENDTRTVVILGDVTSTQDIEPVTKNTDNTFLNLLGIKIGDLESDVIETFGYPNRKDLSKYGFQWYVYNGDYSRYIQFGIKDGKVVGFYTNSDIWNYKDISYGVLKDKVHEILGKPLESITKGNTIYSKTDEKEEENLFLVDGGYLTFYYDIYENHKVLAIEVIEENVEKSLLGFYGAPSDELKYTFEMEIFDITNSTRYNRGVALVSYDALISATARKHSKDMVDQDYFSHDNLDGKSPFDRIDDDGIGYIYAAENLSYGATSAYQAINNWMNSKGHRETLLSEVERLGVGSAFYDDGKTTHTQNFYTPLN